MKGEEEITLLSGESWILIKGTVLSQKKAESIKKKTKFHRDARILCRVALK